MVANSQRKAGGLSQGEGNVRKPRVRLGGIFLGTHHCVVIFLYMFHCEVLGASTASLVDAKWCSLMGISAQRGQTWCYVLVRRWLMR